MKLSQNQKDLLACIKDKEIRKKVKKEFKRKITLYHTRWKLLDELEPIIFENGKLEKYATKNPLTIDQIKTVIDWMNTWEQLKYTVIPIRFNEDFNDKKQTKNPS